MTPPVYEARDGVHVLLFPDDEIVLRFATVEQDKNARLWAQVTAEKEDGTVLNRARFNLLDSNTRVKFSALCAAHNGQQPADWDQRLLQGLVILQDALASGGEARTPSTVLPAAFPLAVFPAVIERFVTTCAQALPCPVDFLAVPILSLLGAAIGTTRLVEVKQGWRESTRIWTAVIGDPGSKKSPALELAMRPLYRLQRQDQEQYTQDRKAYEDAHVVYEKDLATWKRSKTASPDDRPPSPAAPSFPQLFSTDATVEALAVVLEENLRGILFVRDELAAWARGMNQYKGGKGADRQHWLSFWNGAPSVINRKSQRDPIVLRDPFVGVAGCMPPEVLNDLSDEQGREDGFVHRILFSFPEVMPLSWTDAAISNAVQEDYARAIMSLYSLAPMIDVYGAEVPMTLGFSAQARALFVEWARSHYAELNAPDLHPRLRGPWAKLEGYCVRLALVLFLARVACEETNSSAIDEESVLAGAALMDYFKSHARKVYERLHASPEDLQATAALDWIRRHGGETSGRDLYTYKVAGVTSAKDAEMLLSLLVARGHGVIIEECPPTGGHPRKVFRMHA